MSKPSKLMREESARYRDLVSRGDVVGIRHLRADQLKRKRKLSKVDRNFLKKFEADQKRILRDPESVWKQGLESVHRGLMLLKTLIHEKGATSRGEVAEEARENAASCLSVIAAQLRDDIIRYAEGGSPWACQAVFRDGKVLASAYSRLAIAYPEHFRMVAEKSLTMPSLRGRNAAFTCDAEAIIHAVQLAEKHHASNLHDNRTRIGALCHQFVAEIVDLLEGARLQITQRGDTKHQLFRLPELQGNAATWWKLELKEWVRREFENMRQNPRRNPALWQELEKVTDGGTDSAKRSAFEKYCLNKLEQIAGNGEKTG